MLSFNRQIKVHICTRPTDMRASFDRLAAMTRQTLSHDPMSGHLFVFINQSRSTCKSLYWDGTGLVIIHKRLETGLFCHLNRLWGDAVELTAAEFALFLEGTDLNKRFIESPKAFAFSKAAST
jgi:transposase